MSCIKFPSSKSELSKVPSKESSTDYYSVNCQLISAAENFFGQGNWCHEIKTQTLDYVDYVNGKYQAGCASVVKVELKNGVFHEGVGYSNAEGSSKGSAIQKVRLSSFNDGLRKAFMCFGVDINNKINKSSNRPISPVFVEPPSQSLDKTKQNEISVPKIAVKTDDAFDENIPLSQTDALMNIVDIDQLLFEKDQKSSNVKIVEKEIKTDSSKPLSSTENEKKVPVSSNIKSNQKEIKPQSNDGLNNTVDKNNKACIIDNDLKRANSNDVLKANIPTVMTEEEMRLERKRKQREMQEEFKRREEIKRMHTDVGVKTPNPRY